MSRVAGPELVAEVCRAGGFGILAGLRLTPDELRAQIRRIRELTDKPFGVNHGRTRICGRCASVDARVLEPGTANAERPGDHRCPPSAVRCGPRSAGALAQRDTW